MAGVLMQLPSMKTIQIKGPRALNQLHVDTVGFSFTLFDDSSVAADMDALRQAHSRWAAHVVEEMVACATQNDADHTRVVVLLAELVLCICQVSHDSRQDPSNPALAMPPHSCDHLHRQPRSSTLQFRSDEANARSSRELQCPSLKLWGSASSSPG